jgi:membrane-bound lytic murein transglycosylase D
VDAPATEPGEAPQAGAAPALPEIKYSVQPRDALAKIADRYGVTVDELKEWNGRTSDDLKIGEVLIIHPRKMPTP